MFLLIKELIGDSLQCEIVIAVQLIACCFASLSAVTLLLLNIERYLNIVHPFFARKKVTKIKLLIAAVFFWCVAVVIPVPCRAFAPGFSNFLVGIALFASVFTSIYLYIRIYLASRKAVRDSRSRQGIGIETRQLQDVKLPKTCAIVVGFTFLCLTPLASASLLKIKSYVRAIAAHWAITVAHASSGLNSIIFFWRNPVLRNEATKIIMG